LGGLHYEAGKPPLTRPPLSVDLCVLDLLQDWQDPELLTSESDAGEERFCKVAQPAAARKANRVQRALFSIFSPNASWKEFLEREASSVRQKKCPGKRERPSVVAAILAPQQSLLTVTSPWTFSRRLRFVRA